MPDIPRSSDDIVARLQRVRESSTWFREESFRLIEALEWQDARPFLAEHLRDKAHAEAEWKQVYRTTEQVLAEIRDYLPHCWRCANACKGTSVVRGLSHFRGLLFLLGPATDQLIEFMDEPTNFVYYGKPLLVRISDAVQFNWREEDSDQWVQMQGDEPLTAQQVLTA